jgi:threonine dehydrogenase-like Zn-dependent dehydrogenase
MSRQGDEDSTRASIPLLESARQVCPRCGTAYERVIHLVRRQRNDLWWGGDGLGSRANGVGVHVVIETVGSDEMIQLATTLVRPVGHLAKISSHGSPTPVRSDNYWNRDIRVTTGLVDASSTPTLIRLVSSDQIRAHELVTHRFAWDDMLKAYDTFDNAHLHRALKVAIGGATSARASV